MTDYAPVCANRPLGTGCLAAIVFLLLANGMVTVSLAQTQPPPVPPPTRPDASGHREKKPPKEPSTLDDLERRNDSKGAETQTKTKPRKEVTIERVYKAWIPITMNAGHKEGVRLHQVFLLYELDANGNKIVIGKASVAVVGPGYVAAGGGSSRADAARTVLIVYEYSKVPTRGTMLEETGEFHDPAKQPR